MTDDEPGRAPSSAAQPHQADEKANASTERLVDETDEESFPASDPPESYQVD